MKKTIIAISFFALITGGVMLGWLKLNGNNSREHGVVKRTRFLMDTFCTIQVPGKPEEVDKIIDRAFTRMEEVDRKFNSLNPDSPVYQFNNNRTPITDQEIINLIKIAQKVSEESGGAFDITIEPLVRLWGFYGENPNPRLPSEAEIKKSMESVGYQYLVVNDKEVTSNRTDIKIDLGGIAKGYAIQETIKILKSAGLISALVETGGQVHSYGDIAGQPWKIGIRNPRHEGVIAGLGFPVEMGISTSGDYERFFERDGIRYHHILNPNTGYPAKGIMSMSVITDNPVLADAWSTALFIMGTEKAMKLTETKSEINIIVVDDLGKIVYSTGLSNNLFKK